MQRVRASGWGRPSWARNWQNASVIATALILLAAASQLGCRSAARLRDSSARTWLSSTTRSNNAWIERSPIAVSVEWRVPLDLAGQWAFQPQRFSVAASDGMRVFVGTLGGRLFALRSTDGKTLWSLRLPASIDATPFYDRGTELVFVGADDGFLHAIDASTGTLTWSYRGKGTFGPPPVVHDGVVYFSSSDGRVYAVDAQNGHALWQYERQAPDHFTVRGFSGVFIRGDRAYVGFADGYLAALDRKTGQIVWVRSLAGTSAELVDVDATPLGDRNALYAASYTGGLYGLDPKTGMPIWRTDIDQISGVALAGQALFVTGSKQGIERLDVRGRRVWRQSLTAAGELSQPVAHGPYVLWSGRQAGLFVADASNGHLLALFQPGEGISAPPSVYAGDVFVMSNRGYFYKLRLP